MTIKKMAVFVEGHTELLFVDKLVNALAEKNSVYIEQRKIRGGASVRRTARLINAARPITTEKFFVLIYDCAGDELVKTRLLEEYKNLCAGGYSRAVCVRDIFPKPSSELRNIEDGFPKFIPTKPIKVDFVLAIREVEAWLLAEHTHFSRLDATLTVEAIKAAHGFCPRSDDLMLRDHPANDLDACYKMVGHSYAKGSDAHIDKIDFAQIYFEVSTRFPYLKTLCDVIDDFLSAPSVATC